MAVPRIAVLLAIVAAALVLSLAFNRVQESFENSKQRKRAKKAGQRPKAKKVKSGKQGKHTGMTDIRDPAAYGTTIDANRRYRVDDISPEAAHRPGHLHQCKCGLPSKLAVDGAGGHHMLPHVCTSCKGRPHDPIVLGNASRWNKRKSCPFELKHVGISKRAVKSNM